jgi:hypothetical protein
MNCRHCSASLDIEFADLGTSPPSNSYLKVNQLQKPEIFYPLRVKVCKKCWLVQTEDFARREDFFSPDYSYFSSFSKTWLLHAQDYATKMIERLKLNDKSLVVEVASNDGYLLQYFQAFNIPCIGIEPTRSTALVSSQKGIPTICEFFGAELANMLAKEKKLADLIPANNVLAHVPDMNDFLTGIRILLKNNGVATFEFPHLLQLVQKTQFDTIYHEHYSYLSLISIQNILKTNRLEVFDVEEIPTHGGSLRVYVHKKDSGSHGISDRVETLYKKEKLAGIDTNCFYKNFQNKINDTKDSMLKFLLEIKGKKIIGYGAAAKGNTFINYTGIRSDLLSFVVDKSPHKQNKFLPGSRIPIYGENIIKEFKPDFVVILPWNLKNEISDQLSYIREWGGQFIVAIPKLEIF